MRVQPNQHALDRVLDQVAVAHRLHVLGTHALDHLAEQVEQPVHLGVRDGRAVSRAALRGGVADDAPAGEGAGEGRRDGGCRHAREERRTGEQARAKLHALDSFMARGR